MHFYQECFGGSLHFQTVAETPAGQRFPAGIGDFVLHAILRNGNMVLMATDMGNEELKIGTNISLLVACPSEAELVERYRRLSVGGRAFQPVTRSECGGGMTGGLTDRFGTHWLLNFPG